MMRSHPKKTWWPRGQPIGISIFIGPVVKCPISSLKIPTFTPFRKSIDLRYVWMVKVNLRWHIPSFILKSSPVLSGHHRTAGSFPQQFDAVGWKIMNLQLWSYRELFFIQSTIRLCLSPSIASTIPSFMVSSLIGSCGVLVSKFPIFFSQFPHLWRLREGPRRPGQLNIYGWFNFRMICGYPNFRTPPYPYIYMYILNDWNHVQWPSKSQFIANGIMYWYVLDIQQKVIICVIIDT